MTVQHFAAEKRHDNMKFKQWLRGKLAGTHAYVVGAHCAASLRPRRRKHNELAYPDSEMWHPAALACRKAERETKHDCSRDTGTRLHN